MIKSIHSSLIILGTAILYFALFWQTGLGLNILLFSTVCILLLYFSDAETWASLPVRIAAFGTLLTAALIVWHHSLLAIIAHYCSFILLIGFMQHRALRFFWFGLLLGLQSVFSSPIRLRRVVGKVQEHAPLRVSFRWIRLLFIPLLIGLIFFFLYYQANAPFAKWISSIWQMSFLYFFEQLSFYQLFFFLFSLLLATSIFTKSEHAANKVQQQGEDTIRRGEYKEKIATFKMLSLKTEYQTALLTLGLLNSLIMMVIFFDLQFIWMDYSIRSYPELRLFVHQGTYVLIFSILLAMGILLYFFRGNLNFFPDNKLVRLLAIIWCVQNGLLALSVGMRNVQYILQTGLAYKRIGVVFFLLLTLFGLWTMVKKIQERKTFTYLLNWNAWAAYGLLLFSALFNWDLIITQYNINKASNNAIDTAFLLNTVSDKNLYLLIEKEQYLLQNGNLSTKETQFALQGKIDRFQKRQQRQDWRDWNWIDHRNRNALDR